MNNCSETQSLLSDAEIISAFQGTNFGSTDYYELLCASVFKKLVGYHCGHTIESIMYKLNLIGKTGIPTKKGVALVREFYGYMMRLGG